MPGSVGLRLQRSAEEVDNRRYMVAVGTDDDAGVNLKDFIQEACKRIDGQRKFGTSTWRTSYDRTEYPVTCTRAAEALARGEVDKAALFGGGGLEKPSRPTRCGGAPPSPPIPTRSKGLCCPTTARCFAWVSASWPRCSPNGWCNGGRATDSTSPPYPPERQIL